METMQDRAREVVNSVGFTENAEAAIAEALQVVADECAGIARAKSRELHVQQDLHLSAGAHAVTNAIRARFPRCPDAK